MNGTVSQSCKGQSLVFRTGASDSSSYTSKTLLRVLFRDLWGRQWHQQQGWMSHSRLSPLHTACAFSLPLDIVFRFIFIVLSCKQMRTQHRHSLKCYQLMAAKILIMEGTRGRNKIKVSLFLLLCNNGVHSGQFVHLLDSKKSNANQQKQNPPHWVQVSNCSRSRDVLAQPTRSPAVKQWPTGINALSDLDCSALSLLPVSSSQ